jgi:hypothetical protein
MTDIFGDIIDADTVEQAFTATLQTWLPDHLAHQERRRNLDAGVLEQPRSWPLVSDVDLELHTQLPAVIIASTGSRVLRHDRGRYTATWRFEVVACIAAATERDARLLAGLYLAAIRGALTQNRTLGGIADNTRWIGPDDHAVGVTRGEGRQRALYGTAFEVDIRDVVNDRLGPSEPSVDPQDPEVPPPLPLEAEITVTAMEETP